MTFERVGESLPRTLRRSPLRPAVLALEVEKESQKILPPWAKMISFREGRLLLSVPSPSHAQELYLQSRVLTRKINEGVGGKIVEKISFRVGTL